MSRYLDPKADLVFKKIFGDHPHLLKSFLNALLPLAADQQIVELSYLPNEQVPEIPTFKRTIADVKCTDAKGRIFIVEVQINWTDSFKQRLLFGTSRAFVKQLEHGQQYKLLQPVYGLGIIADIYEPNSTSWYHHYRLVKTESKDSDIIEHLQLIFIELPKFPVCSQQGKKLRLLWLRFLREVGEKTVHVAQELLDVPEISEAITLTEEAAYTPGELNAYDEYWDSVSRERTLLADRYEEGLIKGFAKGEAKGEAKGRAEGLAKGIEKIAINMLKNGESLAKISAFTGLSSTDLTKLWDRVR